MSKKFAEHGQVTFSIEQGLLLIQATGPANLEMVQSYRERVLHYHEKLQHKPWGSVAVLKGEPFTTDESREFLIAGVKVAQSHNLVAAGVVIISEDYPTVSINFWQSIYDKTTVPYQFFNSVDEAKHWVKTQIASHQ